MAQLETWIRQDLKKPLQVQYLNGTMFSQDNAANLVGVEVFDDGEPATLGGSVSANVVRSDGGTVAVSGGTLSGNKVSVILPQAAYAIPGAISIIIKLTTGGTVTTLGAIVVTVYRSSTDAVVDPGTIIPSVQNLISQIETAVASIPADYSSLWTSLAPAFSTSTAYTAGQHVTYNGHLYRFTADHAEGSFVNTDCTQVDVGGELSALKSAFEFTQDDVETLKESMPTEIFSRNSITEQIKYERIAIGNDGTESPSTTRLASSFIRLGNGVKVHNSNPSSSNGMQYWIRVYDEDKEFIANATFTSENAVIVGTGDGYSLTAVEDANLDNIIAVNSSAKYVRLSIRFMETSSTTIVPSDVWFTYTANVPNGKSLNDVYFSGEIDPEDTSFFDVSTNLYDGHTLTTGRLKTDGTIDTTKTTFATTDYIDIHGNDGKYIMAENTSGAIGYYGVGFYNKNKIFISGNGSTSVAAIQIPSNAVYVRMTIINSGNVFPFIGISSSSNAMPYEPYYKILKEDSLPAPDRNWYKGKKISALGDSITENGNDLGVSSSHSAWRQFVYELLLLSSPVVNNGIGGTRVSGDGENAMWKDSRINAIALDSDVILFNGGMNDWGGNAEIGTEDSVDTDTFMGALNVVAVKLITRFPAKRIFWMTTTYGRNDNDVTPDLNSLNLTTWDYAEAIRTIAKKYGFPVIDLAAECGWNKVNYATYLNAEEGIYIHPNRNGGKRMAEVIVGRLAQFQPVTMT